ncbi:MAG: chloride channel protein, partial [Deltaproteobacteria bacterium]|nr:chloride channel protein [Deltaproteobacteria bacterium]
EITESFINSDKIFPQRFFGFLFPVVGGLLVGWLTMRWAPETRGGGTETYLKCFHQNSGKLKKRTTVVKFFASLFTLGSGGSGGKEGPVTLMGAGIGSLIGVLLQLGARAQRTLFLAGAAGGLGAIFRTPLGGAITAVEVLYKEDFESDALIPAIIASVSAYTTFGAFYGFGHILSFKAGLFHTPFELIFYIVLALVCTASAYLFVKLYQWTGEGFFAQLKIKPQYLPALGGLGLALLALFVPEVIGGGLLFMQKVLHSQYPKEFWTALAFFLGLAFFKMLSTSLTIQSGGSAGILVPSFFIGGMMGGACGLVFHQLFPQWVPEVTPFIIVGMASFFSSVTRASLGALVMVTEITGGYELLPPLMVVSVVSLIFSRHSSIFKNQVDNKFYSKAHLWDMNPKLLNRLKVGEAFHNFSSQAIIPQSLPLQDLRNLAKKEHEFYFFVKDEEGNLVGRLSIHSLEEVEENLEDLKDLVVAEDFCEKTSLFVTPQNTLFEALEVLKNSGFDKVAVVESLTKPRLLGYLSRQAILNFYNSLGTASA